MKNKPAVLIFDPDAAREEYAAQAQLSGVCSLVTILDDPDDVTVNAQSNDRLYDAAVAIFPQTDDGAEQGEWIAVDGRTALMLNMCENAGIPTLPLPLSILERYPSQFFGFFDRKTHHPSPLSTPLTYDTLAGLPNGTFGQVYLSRNWREIFRVLRKSIK